MFGHPRPYPTPPIGYRRLYMLPNRHGLAFGGLLGIILLGAINYDNALAYLLCFLLGGLLLVAMLQGYHNLAGLQLGAAAGRAAFAGELAEFQVRLAGTSGRPRYAVTISALLEDGRPWWRGDRRIASCQAEVLTPATVITLAVPALRRGWQPLGRLRVETHFPLGVLGGWAYLETRARALVYPRPAGTLPLPRTLLPGGSGEGGNQPGADDFAGLRAYRPGDAPRRLHWPSFARQETLLVKRFSGDAERDVALDWGSVAHLADPEDRLSQLCQWVLAAEHQGLRYSLTLPGSPALPPGRGPAQREAALEALACHGLPDADA